MKNFIKRTIDRIRRKPLLVKPVVSKRVFNIWEHNGWGNSIQWIDYENRKLYGFIKNPKVKIGDEFLEKMESGKIMRFEVIKLDYKYNPTDMFFATVKDIGYYTC